MGSGKSSVLNLLRQHIKESYPQALVVSFNPWLVSGRNDLISEFISELIRTINADPKASERSRKLVRRSQNMVSLSPLPRQPGFPCWALSSKAGAVLSRRPSRAMKVSPGSNPGS
ncbi:P-loop NTPase fold protein [Bradyrhizobium sp. DASA03076]|uniref:P-loop NTPase fold protein n=1 Tax=Bradyrhizobium sp. BLXBL-03 TaxID=3395916 RepID=UPI003F6F7C88